MYGGSGGSPAGSPSSRTLPAAVRRSARRAHDRAAGSARDEFSPGRRRREGRASASQTPPSSALQQQYLHGSARRPPQPEAGRDDAGVVDDDELTGQLAGQVGEDAMPDLSRLAAVDKQARLVAVLRRVLGDQLGRQLVVELGADLIRRPE